VEYLFLFLLGAVVAFVVSIPIGAVNVAIFQSTLFHNRRAGYAIGLGAVTAEMIYCAIPLFSLTVFLKDSGILDALFIVFIPLLMFLGIYNIIRRNKGSEKEGDAMIPTQRRSMRGYVVYGFFLCLSNPMTLLFWIQATGVLLKQKMIVDAWDTLAFTMGVPTGTFLLYSIFVVLADRTRSKLNPKLHARLNVLIGGIFIFLSLYLLVRYLFLDNLSF
jgi:threonine/homoserine/homoserine lactone efflux protein